ncbi:toll/interleukin-1 receptor domain-containing protein [Paraburkholderia sp. UCT2]|nr:toll/interleukin-1 receptor domain-containing protein [Paraburkholderia sp. UCT2]
MGHAMNEDPERQWETLLDSIEDGRVIPVIGPELVLLPDDGTLVPIDQWISKRLLKRLNLPECDLPKRLTYNDVVSRYLSCGGDRQEIYSDIYAILKPGITLTHDHALRDLASIEAFKLFVLLTCDPALAQAIDDARPQQRALRIAYAPNNISDLPVPFEDLTEPVVFHLLGKACCAPEFVTCEEDLLEFLHALQDRQRQPEHLFDALREHYLLILGCGLNDWVTRFFLRASRSAGLSQSRRFCETLVGEQADDAAGLLLFLENFSRKTRVVKTSSYTFAKELARRWRLRHHGDTPPSRPVAAARVAKMAARGAIFISYASENQRAAKQLASALSMHHLDVWFDLEALHAGDDWDEKIRRNVERCSLFVPIVSRETLRESNRRRYFWREWNSASRIADGIAAGEPFIVPVVIDDTCMESADALPACFRRRQAIDAPGGKIDAASIGQLAQLVREFHRRQPAH